MSKTEWKIPNQWPAGDPDTDDCYVRLGPDCIEISHGEDDQYAVEFTFSETHGLAAALKAALKEWTRRGVV